MKNFLKNTAVSLAAVTVLGISGATLGISNAEEVSAAPAMTQTTSAGVEWTDAADVKLVTDELLSTIIDPRADGESNVVYNGETWKAKRETYKPTDRTWQGLVSIAAVGDRLWVCWYTGGRKEPDPFNYIAMAYSDDGGLNWVDPYLIVDHADKNTNNVFTVVPNLFVDEDGDLWLTYIQSQFWGIRFDNAECENIEDLTWDAPIAFGTMKTNQPPTLITNADGSKEWIITSEGEVGNSHTDTTYIYGSKDKGKTWKVKARVQSSAATARKWPESQVVQCDGGNMILASRLEGGTVGGVEVAYSSDYGVTWTEYQNNLEKPFIGPGSKFFMLRLSSGNILMLNHGTSSSRSKIMAYLSEDGGKTWPYSLSLDERDDVSYPSAFELNGKIYAAWDKGRYIEKEMRFSAFTEEDIKAGHILSEGSVKRALISRPTDYADIEEIQNEYPSYVEKTVGTKSSEIRNMLPTEIKVLGDDGNEYTLTGTWKSSGYKENIPGYYLLTFEADTFPGKLSDGADKLSVVVRLVEEEKGCKGSVGLGASLGALALLPLALKRKKRK